jgi:hypothetical protein
VQDHLRASGATSPDEFPRRQDSRFPKAGLVDNGSSWPYSTVLLVGDGAAVSRSAWAVARPPNLRAQGVGERPPPHEGHNCGPRGRSAHTQDGEGACALPSRKSHHTANSLPCPLRPSPPEASWLLTEGEIERPRQPPTAAQQPPSAATAATSDAAAGPTAASARGCRGC